MLDGLPGCVIGIYQPETQLQSTLTSTSKGNDRMLAYPVFFPWSVLERLLPLWEATAEVSFSVSHAQTDTVALHVIWTESFSNHSTLKRLSCPPFCIPYHYLLAGTCFFIIFESFYDCKALSFTVPFCKTWCCFPRGSIWCCFQTQIVWKITSDLGITPRMVRTPPFFLCLLPGWDVKGILL